jgi:large subunit ribosomal protein L22
MARARTEPVEEQQEVRAQAKWLRIAPRKARLVVEHIRGRTVPEARSVLAFTPRAAAREIEKVLASAVANAEANHNLLGDELVITAAYVDEGPTIKRWRPRARGRVARIKKRTCHVTLKLQPFEAAVETPRDTPAEEPKKPRRRRAASKASSTQEQPQASSENQSEES